MLIDILPTDIIKIILFHVATPIALKLKPHEKPTTLESFFDLVRSLDVCTRTANVFKDVR